MVSTFKTRFDNVGRPRLLDVLGESLDYFPAGGGMRTITGTLERLQSRFEDLDGFRIEIESANVHSRDTAAGLDGATAGAYIDAADDGVHFWDYQQQITRGGGMMTCVFERATLLDIGHEPRDDENGDTSPTIAEDKLRQMVADSETFRDGQTETVALQRVHRGGYTGPFVRPLACVWWETYDATINAAGSMDHSQPSGVLVLHMQYDGESDPAEFFGGVIEDIRNQAGADDPAGPYSESHLSLQTFSVGEVMQADKRYPQSLPFSVCRVLWTWGDA